MFIEYTSSIRSLLDGLAETLPAAEDETMTARRLDALRSNLEAMAAELR